MSLVRSAALRSGLARISAMRSVESVAARLSGVVALRLSDVVALRLSGAVAQAPSTDAIAPTTASEKDAFRMSRVAMTRSMAPLYRSRVYARPASDFAADGGRSRGDGPSGPRGVRRFRDGAPDRTSRHTLFFGSWRRAAYQSSMPSRCFTACGPRSARRTRILNTSTPEWVRSFRPEVVTASLRTTNRP